MRILPKEHYEELKEIIFNVQGLYPVTIQELERMYSEVKHWADANSRLAENDDVVDGRTYGILNLSERANAYSKKDGKWHNFHGDIYITVWTWSNTAKRFICENAWGVTSAIHPKNVPLLIELP